MENIFVEFLPPWVETGLQPAFYDKESGSVLQQTARMYARVNMLIRMFNKLSKQTKETVDTYVKSFNELYTYVHDYFDNLDVQEEINNKLDEMAESGGLQELIINYFKNYQVSYEEFGAKGDGVTDDFQAILSAHTYANAHGIPVKAEAEKVYYVKNITQAIPVKTDVDWNGSKFIIDDSDNPLNNWLFDIANDEAAFDATGLISSLKKGQAICSITGYGNIIAEVENSNKKDFIRTGDNANQGDNRREYIRIDNSGNILDEIYFPFTNITSLKIKKIEKTYVTVKNGVFETLVNTIDSYNYYKRGIFVERSNVIIDNITHYVTGESDTSVSSPYNGFINTNFNCNVRIQNCNLWGHKTFYTSDSVGKGSYDINNWGTIGLYYDNVKQINDTINRAIWAIHGGNYCRNIHFSNCSLSNIDTHRGSNNIYVDNCVLGSRGIVLCGFGECNINNTQVTSYHFMRLSETYGSWFDGTINITNSRFIVNENRISYVIRAVDESDGTHDYGYECYMPKVNINNLVIDWGSVSSNTTVIFAFKEYNNIDYSADYTTNTGNGVYPQVFRGGQTFTLKDIKIVSDHTYTTSGLLQLFRQEVEKLYVEKTGSCKDKSSNSSQISRTATPNMGISIDNVQFINPESSITYSGTRCSLWYPGGFTALTGDITNTHRPVLNIEINNCSDLYLAIDGRPVSFKITNSVVKQIKSSTSSLYLFAECYNCTFDIPTDNTWIYVHHFTYHFENCYFNIHGLSIDDIANHNIFLQPYTANSGVALTTTTNINPSYSFSNADLNASTRFTGVAQNYTTPQDILNTVAGKVYYRKAGTTSNRPTPTDGAITLSFGTFLLPNGLMYYNTTDSKIDVYMNGSWV